MYRRAEGLPHAPIAFVFLEHAFGMELKPDHKPMARIVESLDQTVFGMRHGFEMSAKPAHTLMMVAVHLQRGTPIPRSERRAGNDAHQMPVIVVVFSVVNVFQIGLLLFLYIDIQRAAANHVEQLRSAADAEDRKI